MDVEDFIGGPIEDVLKREPTSRECNARKSRNGLFRGYCSNWPGKGTDHVGEGRCSNHGGATPSGPAHGAWKHGAYSDVVREEDIPVLESLEELSTAKKLEDTLNLQVLKLRRAVGLMDNPDRERNFWETFSELVDSAGDGGEELDATQIKALAGMLDSPHRAQRDLMGLIRRTAKTLHDITEGQTVRHEHDVDEETLSELKGRLNEL